MEKWYKCMKLTFFFIYIYSVPAKTKVVLLPLTTATAPLVPANNRFDARKQLIGEKKGQINVELEWT